MSRTDGPPRTANRADAVPSDADVARFRDDLAALCDTDRARLLVAVSGGPDSMALLLLAAATLGERCMAATVDHGLRPESADEAGWVADLCTARGIRHAVLTMPLPDRAGQTANISARARQLRYGALQAHAARYHALIATAHHADDQRETVVMRLNRGAGVGGLAGIRARSGRIVRPLLGWRRSELAAIVAGSGIVPIDDPSNIDDRFDRARLRRVIGAADWLDPLRLVRSTRALADADDALDWSARRLAGDLIAAGAGRTLTLTLVPMPAELRRRLVLLCLDAVEPVAAPRGPAVDRFLALLDAGRPAMLGAVLATPANGLGDRAIWRFGPAPPRRPT